MAREPMGQFVVEIEVGKGENEVVFVMGQIQMPGLQDLFRNVPIVVYLYVRQSRGSGTCRHQLLQIGQVQHVGRPESAEKDTPAVSVIGNTQVVAVGVQVEDGPGLLVHDAESL